MFAHTAPRVTVLVLYINRFQKDTRCFLFSKYLYTTKEMNAFGKQGEVYLQHQKHGEVRIHVVIYFLLLKTGRHLPLKISYLFIIHLNKCIAIYSKRFVLT